MKKFLKGIAVALALALVITPCAILFAGCGDAEEGEVYTGNNYVVYIAIEDDAEYAPYEGEFCEVVEEVKKGDVIVGKIYKIEIGVAPSYYNPNLKVTILNDTTLEFSAEISEEFSENTKASEKYTYTMLYEKYKGIYIARIVGENYSPLFAFELIDGQIIGLMESTYNPENPTNIADIKTEIDDYKASGKSWVVYFGDNGFSFMK